MPRTVGIGYQNFEDIIIKNNFYIDKSNFIKEWWANGDVATLLTRPRRFGKTLNLSMLECFFSVKYAGRDDLFQNLSIWNEPDFRKIQGSYPVIFLSFASVKETSFLNTRKKICQIISNLYNMYDFLLESDCLNENEKKSYHSISPDMEDYLASFSLNMLSEYLMRYYGKKVIILLDEYDTPLLEAYAGGYWDELVAFTRNLFNSTFKTNPYLERALITGITRISKESIFSDLNNLEVVTTTSEKYESSYGFSQDEVWIALKEYDLYESREQVQSWYDGFTFGKKTDIYNPWSIINFLSKRKFSPYWANTSSNSLIGNLIRKGSPDVKIIIEDLLNGKDFTAQIDEQIIFNQLDYDETAIWSLFLASGYLKVVQYTFHEEQGIDEYRLSLTNKEVLIMFKKMIGGWFSRTVPAYNEFIKAMLLDDTNAMNTYMNRVALATFSYFDTGKAPSEEREPERFYHGFVLGLMVDLEGRYRITSNRESGFGRYDIVLEPLQDHDNAFIIEFKVFNPKREQSLDDTANNALSQIEAMNYTSELNARGITSERIRQYGFAFRGKEVLIASL